MTIVGKILVFINLVFSIAVGLLVVFVYATRTHYADALKKEHDARVIEQADLKQYRTDRDELYKKMNDEEARFKAEHERVANQLKDQQELNKSQKDSWDKEKEKSARFEVLQKSAEAEVERRQKDVEKMRVTLKEEMDKTIALVDQKNTLLQRTTAAEIESRTTRDRNTRLEAQLQEMARDIAKYRATLGSAPTVSKTGKNPPSEYVDGLVSTVDPSGLVKLTIGSDSGLSRGHTLEIYRINRLNPQQSRYLGTLRIIDVKEKEAVAQPMDKLNAPIQVGDTVASQILGKS